MTENIRLPEHLTFTGFDDHTDVAGMIELSAKYPIEWAMLLSPSRQGVDPRYPGAEAQSRFMWCGLRIAAHLCGDYSAAIMARQRFDAPVDLGYFRAIQINHREPDVAAVTHFRRGWTNAPIILQTRADEFPDDASVAWLFDASGGMGVVPKSWPKHPGGNRFVGYAGGIGPDNVRSVMARINPQGRYWLDMETGIRTNNLLDLTLCRQVCERVYGVRP